MQTIKLVPPRLSRGDTQLPCRLLLTKCPGLHASSQAVMELLSDAVPNVRLAALSLLPALKQTIRLPEDVQQLVRHCLACRQQHHIQGPAL